MKTISVLVSILCLVTVSQPAQAAPNTAEIEVLQTEATVYYHAKDNIRCISTIRKVLALDPKNVNALELQALLQRQMKEDDSAALTYEMLVKVGPSTKKPAYHFELAMIRYKQKKNADARKHFKLAADGNFNPGVSHFFLGVMEFSAKAWKTAKYHLAASMTHSDGKPMLPVTRYYLASTYTQLGKTDAAIRNYHAAEVAVEESKNEKSAPEGFNSLSGNIRKNALKELKALDKSAQYINITMMSQWDNNVQTNPSEVDNPVAKSSQRSAKTIISGAIGYSSSPTRTLQISPSYRFFTNYNLHYLARDFNFISHTATLYALYKPYARLSVGLKGEGTFSMKNNLTAIDSRSSLKYRPFSLTGDAGPVAKYELNPRILLGAEATLRPKVFYLDPDDGDTRRSGNGLFARLTGEYISPFWYINPTLYGSFEWDHPVGRDFRAYTWGAGFSNPVQLSDKLTATGSIDLLAADYYDKLIPKKRSDTILVYRLAGSYLINPNWSALGDLSYTRSNSSIVTSFTYNRIVVSGGASYTF